MQALLKVQGVAEEKHTGLIFRKHYRVLCDISLDLEERRTFGLMGSSGSGKTTLGKIMAGLKRPSSGHVFFKGEDIWSMDREKFSRFRREVQMIFQDPEGSLNPRKSIGRSINDILSLIKAPKREWGKRVSEMLDAVGLSDDLLCRYPMQLSGGQNQRIAIGRVLLLEPEVIILDEPTSALDISVQAQILNLLKELQRDRGLAYILISHQEEVVKFMAHSVGMLEEGKLILKM